MTSPSHSSTKDPEHTSHRGQAGQVSRRALARGVRPWVSKRKLIITNECLKATTQWAPRAVTVTVLHDRAMLKGMTIKGSERNLQYVNMKVTQSRPTLCNPMDYTIHGILQARTVK